jgi:hypothetical protein
MKKIILSLTIAAFLISGVAYASFPVKKEEVKIEAVTKSKEDNPVSKTEKSITKLNKKADKKAAAPSAPAVDEEFIITLLLLLFLGGLAAHRWYKGKPAGWNILFILTAGGCGIWALVDLVNILTKKF